MQPGDGKSDQLGTPNTKPEIQLSDQIRAASTHYQGYGASQPTRSRRSNSFITSYLENSNSSFYSSQEINETASESNLSGAISHTLDNAVETRLQNARFSADYIYHSLTDEISDHYNRLVKYLPILIILIPSLLKLLSPEIIKVGDLVQIGDNHNNPSTIVVDVFSVLLLCWVIHFLLDWPWKWYLQIREIQQDVTSRLQNTSDGLSDPNTSNSQQLLKENLNHLTLRRTFSLALCLLAPFLCGWLLILARKYILLIEEKGSQIHQSPIFSDLNIAVFVSCGLIRIVIHISEILETSTADIGDKTKKIVQETQRFEDVYPKEHVEVEVSQTKFEEDIRKLNHRLDDLTSSLVHMNDRFALFYSKNKFAIENDQTFLSSKHFKILEREVNDLHRKVDSNTYDLSQIITAATNSTRTYSLKIEGQQNQALNHADKMPIVSSPSSLHGVPLSRKTPTYSINHESNTAPSSTANQTNRSSVNQLSGLSKLSQFFPIIKEYVVEDSKAGYSGTQIQQSPYVTESRLVDENTINELANYKKSHAFDIFDLGSIPIVKYTINVPFQLQTIAWKIISFLPIKLLRLVYLTLLVILEFLLELYHAQNSKENNSKAEESNSHLGVVL